MMDVPKKELESVLHNKTGLQEGDFIFFYNKIRKSMRYFPWNILWIDAHTRATGNFPWWPESGIVHKATKYEYDQLLKALPTVFANCDTNTQ
jgi:hypothetical protein